MLTTFSIMILWTITMTPLNLAPSLSIMLLSTMLLSFILLAHTPLLSPSQISIYTTTDSFNTMLICLTLWISLLMFLISTKLFYTTNLSSTFNFSVPLLNLVVILFFSTDNLFLFYMFFELSLIPTLLLILKWGYQPERLQAGTYFMMYTISASLPLLLMILTFKSQTLHLNMTLMFPMPTMSLYNLQPFYPWMFTAFILAFLVKIPMWGVHLWLPKAHVEAPVSGSMILAGILLKLGGYGLMKAYALTLMMQAKTVYHFLITLSIWSTVTVSMNCLRQTDLKSLIAYSSIVHMALMIASIMTGFYIGWLGAMMMMIAHGLSSPGLFVMANYNYDKSSSRNIKLQKGIMLTHPLSSMLWFILLAANMAAPPSLNLGSELLIFTSILKKTSILILPLASASFLSAAYNLYLYSSQQGNTNRFLTSSTPFNSQMFLTNLLHFFPIIMLILNLNTFYMN